MTSIQTAYVNALLADASYVKEVSVGDIIVNNFKDRLTETQATYLAANFTVKATTDPTADGFNAAVWEGKPGTEFAGQIRLRNNIMPTPYQFTAAQIAQITTLRQQRFCRDNGVMRKVGANSSRCPKTRL